MKYEKQILDLISKEIALARKGVTADDKNSKKIRNQINQLHLLQKKDECFRKNNQG
jgi:gamma-glutamyltranspeptidase